MSVSLFKTYVPETVPDGIYDPCTYTYRAYNVSTLEPIVEFERARADCTTQREAREAVQDWLRMESDLMDDDEVTARLLLWAVEELNTNTIVFVGGSCQWMIEIDDVAQFEIDAQR